MLYRVIGASILAFIVLSIPEILEFATGRADLEGLGLLVEIMESSALAVVIAAFTWLFFKLQEIRMERAALSVDLVQSRAENIMWRERSSAQMDGVRRAIEEQFDTWRFTPAEKEIASLILKGCTHKQIAETRRSSDTTVRQHAQSIYRKSGLENRSELAAYFLDAILHAPATPHEDEAAAARASALGSQLPSAVGNNQ